MQRETYIEHTVIPDKVERPGSNSHPEEKEDTKRQGACLWVSAGKQTNEYNEDTEGKDIGNSLDQDRSTVSEDQSSADIG